MSDNQEGVEDQGVPPPSPALPWEKYRLSAQGERLSAEGLAPEAVPYLPPGIGVDHVPKPAESSKTSAEEPQKDTEKRKRTEKKRRLPKLPMPRALRIFTRGEGTLIAISIFGLVASAVVLVNSATAKSVGVFALVALVPMTVVVGVLLWSDRFAPLRVRYLVLSALWGGGVATVFAGLVNSGFLDDFISIIGDVSRAEILTAVVVAPIAEELFKGVGVVLVLVFARRYVVHPANGLVAGAVVGAAFAYVENIQYFLEAEAEGTAVLGITIFARAVLSPFVHPMATSFTGYFFALALLRRKGAWGWTWRIVAGFSIAMLVHALWNGMAMGGIYWILLYILVEMPLFIAWIVWVLRMASKQSRLLREGLAPYYVAGWISFDEVEMVCDRRARKHARKWARKVGRDARKSVRAYLVNAGRLGLDQLNMERGGPDPERVALARESLANMVGSRERFLRLGALHAATSKP